ncbi:MAG: rRNA maturation RNase YbeY [Bacteroidetes bacterium]|nr:rRNA maturation RNase YbeY [Bacteroidota bacterium]
MIQFNYRCDFSLADEIQIENWLQLCAADENKEIGELAFFFCTDAEILALNQEHLGHDFYTDILTFDYVVGNLLFGDIFISVERVSENAKTLQISFELELQRVIIHGLLHLCGYTDKTDTDSALMRVKENEKLKLFHVKP